MEWARFWTAVAALGTAISAWIAWRQHQQQQAKERLKSPPPTPLPTPKPTPSPPPVATFNSPPVPFPTTYNPPNLDLASEVGADYSTLRDLLAAKRYKEADAETVRMMLWVRRAEKRGYLDEDDIRKFPCTDLQTIDRLWVNYSSGRFDFSVQKQIYESVGKNLNKFYHEVEWKRRYKWVSYDNLTFDRRAHAGHLPSRRWGICGISGLGWFVVGLFSRAETCKL